ncbi:FHA domain-containing protein [Candidatus Uabimicrobium sp. HlEnr_7]|uniref:FHA domain-containing protein n=1 Tax=Candidatus Uabimicrobium helgolandensis TaxID=3095367 RepID=UPI003556293D
MDTSQKFIDCALQQKYITLKHVQECKEIQQNFPTLTIEQILITHNFLDEAKAKIIHAILKYKNEELDEKLNTTVKRKKDRVVADVLLHEELVTSDEILKLVSLQKRLQKEGMNYSLINVAIAKGFLWPNGEWGNWIELPKNEQHKEILFLIKSDKNAGKSFLINKEELLIKFLAKGDWTIGRFANTNKVVVDDNTVSRVHCKFSIAQEQWTVADMMSSLGIYVNEEKVQKKQLKNNDIIRIAQKQFHVKVR